MEEKTNTVDVETTKKPRRRRTSVKKTAEPAAVATEAPKRRRSRTATAKKQPAIEAKPASKQEPEPQPKVEEKTPVAEPKQAEPAKVRTPEPQAEVAPEHPAPELATQNEDNPRLKTMAKWFVGGLAVLCVLIVLVAVCNL